MCRLPSGLQPFRLHEDVRVFVYVRHRTGNHLLEPCDPVPGILHLKMDGLHQVVDLIDHPSLVPPSAQQHVEPLRVLTVQTESAGQLKLRVVLLQIAQYRDHLVIEGNADNAAVILDAPEDEDRLPPVLAVRYLVRTFSQPGDRIPEAVPLDGLPAYLFHV